MENETDNTSLPWNQFEQYVEMVWGKVKQQQSPPPRPSTHTNHDIKKQKNVF